MLRASPRLGSAALLLVAGLALLCGGAATPSASAVSDATVVGRIVVAHQDGATPTDTRMIPLLETTQGPIALRLPQGLPAPLGTRLTVKHPRYVDGAIVGGGLSYLGPPTIPVQGNQFVGPADFTPGPKKVLVLLAQIAGQPAPGSADAIRNIVFTAPYSANAFIQQESFGQLSLTGKLRSDGDVYGPYLVTSAAKAGVCDNVAWGQDAEKQFNTTTHQVAESWDEVIVVFQSSDCPFSGVGEVGDLNAGVGARHAWINAIGSNGVPTTSVLAHELGHNFGADHAGGLQCTQNGVRISFSDACAVSETTETPDTELPDQYLDPFDVMGNGIHEESAYHRWESGWLPATSAETVTTSGTYLIAPEETPMSAVQLLEVPRGFSLQSYWLDFRQPLGAPFDDFSASDPVVNGVSIRLANSSAMAHPAKSWLIDTTPATNDFSDAPLALGKTYTDPVRGISITTLAVSPLGALVRITVPNGSDTTAPGPASGLTASVVGGAVHLSWTAGSDDSGIVQHYRVMRNGVLLSDVYQTATDDTAPLGGRTSTYSVTAIDAAGNESTPVQVQVALADTTAPGAPGGLGASISGSGVNLSWSPALDDVGVAWYEVDRDGQQIANGWQSTTLSDPNVAAGTHTYEVRAFDSAGNASAFASLRVVVVGPAAVVVAKAKLQTVTALKLKRVGKHRVLVSWKATRGARRYQVLRSGKKPTLLATVKKVQYLDGHATTGALVKSRYVVRAVLG
jgi:hypothetical protein